MFKTTASWHGWCFKKTASQHLHFANFLLDCDSIDSMWLARDAILFFGAYLSLWYFCICVCDILVFVFVVFLYFCKLFAELRLTGIWKRNVLSTLHFAKVFSKSISMCTMNNEQWGIFLYNEQFNVLTEHGLVECKLPPNQFHLPLKFSETTNY